MKLSDLVKEHNHKQGYKDFAWQGSFEDYLELFKKKPAIARTAFQRVYDMILSHGTEEYIDTKKPVIRYNFFKDPLDNGRDAIFGLDVPLMKMIAIFKAAAFGYGPEKRVILLHGPVGSSKSTIVRLIKKGLEAHSQTDEGALYTFDWLPGDLEKSDIFRGVDRVPCPMHEEPLKLLPREARQQLLGDMNRDLADGKKLLLDGDLCPPCRYFYRELNNYYKGDWSKVLDHIRVRRLIISEKDRVGIGTFQPKDEKNQDSTELTGDINYRKIAEFGADSDPRAFNFDGEFNIANRGLIEFIEVLKLDVAFLYDLLCASQEHKIKPKKFAQTDIDEVILAHTNEAEFRKLQNNEFMEALRDRTMKVDIPYITKLGQEVKIYDRDFNAEKIRGKHIAPHTLEMASMWAVLTRLDEPKKINMTLLQKMKLYDGRLVTGFTEDNVKELRKECDREGLDGISPRYIQDRISSTLVHHRTESCVNPFMVLSEIESGLRHHALIKNDEQKKRYAELLSVVRDEYEDIVKNEVQRAISADEEALQRLAGNYVDNIKAHTLQEKIKNKYSGQYEAPDERFMRSIEEKIDIPESRKDDFRREIINYITALASDNKVFDFKTNERLHRALELKLFEDRKDALKLTSLLTSSGDRQAQERIDVVKARLIKNDGYCSICAGDVLNYVASVFARGDVKNSD